MQQLKVKKIYSQSVSPVATHLTPSFDSKYSFDV